MKSISDSSGKRSIISQKSVVSIAYEQNIAAKHICKPFAGHVVSSRLMKRKEKINRMIMVNILKFRVIPSTALIAVQWKHASSKRRNLDSTV